MKIVTPYMFNPEQFFWQPWKPGAKYLANMLLSMMANKKTLTALKDNPEKS